MQCRKMSDDDIQSLRISDISIRFFLSDSQLEIIINQMVFTDDLSTGMSSERCSFEQVFFDHSDIILTLSLIHI